MRLFNKLYILTIVVGGFLSASSCLFYDTGDATVGSTPISMAISAIYVLIALFLPLEQQLYLIALSLPNTKALGFGGISCAIVICALAVVKYYVIDRNKSKPSVGIFLYLLFSIQFLLRFNDVTIGVVMPIKQILNMLFFTVLASSAKIAQEPFEIGLKSSIALFMGISSAFLSSIIGFTDFGRFATAGNDSNILAIEAAFVLSYICIAYTRTILLRDWVFYLMAAVLGVICALCGSRMGFILFALILGTTVLFNMKHARKTFTLVALGVIAVFAFLMSSFGQNVIEVIIMRLELLEEADNVSNGRFQLWELYISTMNSDPFLWLFGLGDYTQYGIEDQAHNFLIEDVTSYGIIGVVILYSTYLSIYKRQLWLYKIFTRKPHFSLYRMLPFLIPIIGGLTLHSMMSVMNTTMLYIGVLALANTKKVDTNIINR